MKTEKTRLLKSKGERTTITYVNKFYLFHIEILKIKGGNNSKL